MAWAGVLWYHRKQPNVEGRRVKKNKEVLEVIFQNEHHPKTQNFKSTAYLKIQFDCTYSEQKTWIINPFVPKCLNGRFGSFLVFASFSSRAATIPSSLYAIEVAASNKVSGLCKQRFLSKLLQISSSLCVIAGESKLNCRLFPLFMHDTRFWNVTTSQVEKN